MEKGESYIRDRQDAINALLTQLSLTFLHPNEKTEVPAKLKLQIMYGNAYICVSLVDEDTKLSTFKDFTPYTGALTATNDIFTRLVDGRYTVWSRGAEETFGYTAAEILGKTYEEVMRMLYSEDERKRIEYFMQNLEQTKGAYKDCVFIAKTKQGNYVAVSWTNIAVGINPRGNSVRIGTVCSNQNSELRRAMFIPHTPFLSLKPINDDRRIFVGSPDAFCVRESRERDKEHTIFPFCVKYNSNLQGKTPRILDAIYYFILQRLTIYAPRVGLSEFTLYRTGASNTFAVVYRDHDDLNLSDVMNRILGELNSQIQSKYLTVHGNGLVNDSAFKVSESSGNTVFTPGFSVVAGKK